MKKSYRYLIYFFLIVITSSCSSEAGMFNIYGTVDLNDDTKVYRVIADQNNQPIRIDSTFVIDSAFKMNGNTQFPLVSFIQIDGYNFNIPFILEEGNIKIKIDKDNTNLSRVSGTVSNEHFNKYKLETKEFVDAVNEIRNDIQIAAQNGNNNLINDLQEDYKSVQDQIYALEMEFQKNNYDSFLSLILIDRFVNVKMMTIPEAKQEFDKLTDRIRNSEIGKKLNELLQSPNQPLDVGYIVPDFDAPSPNGLTINLKKELGKVTLLEFWASWCAPCRRENPNLVKIYNRHKDEGFNIIGVSLDKNKDQWIQAIADDYLTWKHVSNLKFWQDPIAKLYNITAIPASFILDQDGKILAKNLRGSQLASKISELLDIK